jgi:hypothetical protein
MFSSKISNNSKHGYTSMGEFGLMVFLERGKKGGLLSESKKIKDPTGSRTLTTPSVETIRVEVALLVGTVVNTEAEVVRARMTVNWMVIVVLWL